MKFAAGDKPGTQKVTVVATSTKLTKEQAIKSLGSHAKKYVVVDFKKSDK